MEVGTSLSDVIASYVVLLINAEQDVAMAIACLYLHDMLIFFENLNFC